MNITARNNIVLQPSDHGFVQAPATGMTCRDCHRDTNGREGGMPLGAANDEMPGFVWHMPPPTMAIPRDLSPAEICKRWLDPALNPVRMVNCEELRRTAADIVRGPATSLRHASAARLPA